MPKEPFGFASMETTTNLLLKGLESHINQALECQRKLTSLVNDYEEMPASEFKTLSELVVSWTENKLTLDAAPQEL